MSYALYKQSHPPTGIEYCVQAHFTGEHDENLIVAKTSFLQVYTLSRPSPLSSSPPHNNSDATDASRSPSLLLVFEKTLFGNIESLCVVRLINKRGRIKEINFIENASLYRLDYQEVKLITW